MGSSNSAKTSYNQPSRDKFRSRNGVSGRQFNEMYQHVYQQQSAAIKRYLHEKNSLVYLPKDICGLITSYLGPRPLYLVLFRGRADRVMVTAIALGDETAVLAGISMWVQWLLPSSLSDFLSSFYIMPALVSDDASIFVPQDFAANTTPSEQMYIDHCFRLSAFQGNISADLTNMILAPCGFHSADAFFSQPLSPHFPRTPELHLLSIDPSKSQTGVDFLMHHPPDTYEYLYPHTKAMYNALSHGLHKTCV